MKFEFSDTIGGFCKSYDAATRSGIIKTFAGDEVNNISDLMISGSARRIIWNGKIGGIESDNVLIVDTLTGGIKGSWLVEDSNLTLANLKFHFNLLTRKLH